MDSGEGREDYYIVFTHSRLRHWLMKWLQPGFQHCYAVKESPGGNFWIIIDRKSSGTMVRMESKVDFPHIRTLVKPTDVVLPVSVKIDPESRRWPVCIFTCVEQVKELLGISALFVLTPWQLYRRLING